MKNRSSIPLHVYFWLFPILFLACSSSHAGLLRYDIAFDSENIGHLVFEAAIGGGTQNLWGSLVNWGLGVDGVYLDSSNSTADADSRFFVDVLGSVIDDGIETIVCTAPPGFPFCAAELRVTDNPVFEGVDGSRIGIFQSSIAGGIVDIRYASGGSSLNFGTLTYSGPSEVSLPATLWLFGSALLIMGALKRKKA
jgi:hypothetical protein